eukprot:3655408-Lingulodinium_polyedra.AAC.1
MRRGGVVELRRIETRRDRDSRAPSLKRTAEVSWKRRGGAPEVPWKRRGNLAQTLSGRRGGVVE